MLALSENPTILAWLQRFSSTELDAATALVDELLLVTRDDFIGGLQALLDGLLSNKNVTKLALYAEQPVIKRGGKIPAFFPNSRHGKATGPGVPPIVVDARDQEVGSEGVVAQFITDYARMHKPQVLAHPGPTKMRRDKIRQIVVVTDFIGSGNRVCQMLESMRHVATLRSWQSYGLIKFLVVAYSGTAEGLAAVRKHKLRPQVKVHSVCPTIWNTFNGKQRNAIEKLCKKYPPKHLSPLGFNAVGALIAFAHGCPNNVPPILHSRAKGWHPLFEGRSTLNNSSAFLPQTSDEVLQRRAEILLKAKKAQRTLASASQREWVSGLLVLAAAEAGQHSADEISARTRLSLHDATSLRNLALKALWLDKKGSITPLGRKELKRLQKRRKAAPILPEGGNSFYYPTQLRAS